jgi:predicted glycoside hydrolase/deacetylase ChbG (UPF0249 family)
MSKAGFKPALIIVADDFGYHPAVNRGIIACLKQGVVTSTDVIVESKILGNTKEIKKFDLGLHLTIKEDELLYLTQLNADFFLQRFLTQLRKFTTIFSRLPSHYSFHSAQYLSHADRQKLLFIMTVTSQELKKRTGIKLRNEISNQFKTLEITDEKKQEQKLLKDLLTHFTTGINTLIVHPALPQIKDKPLSSSYRLETRYQEYNLLTNPNLIATLKQSYILIDFSLVGGDTDNEKRS